MSVATWLFICATVSALADLATLVMLVGWPLLALAGAAGAGDTADDDAVSRARTSTAPVM